MTKTQMIANIFYATLIGAVLMLFAEPAGAQGTNCGPRADVLERLSAGYGETRRGIGLGSKNRVVEVFASPETGSWTVTVTLPDGRTCLVASGQSWEDRMDDLAHLADAEI
ncbi:hypothetical protein [Jannaschia donghaensis]|nr:hypothetical protein [Jannaschia donghaensis]